MPRQNPNGISRIARINLAFSEQLKRDLLDLAYVQKKSVNALVESICADYVKNNAPLLKDFRAFASKHAI